MLFRWPFKPLLGSPDSGRSRATALLRGLVSVVRLAQSLQIAVRVVVASFDMVHLVGKRIAQVLTYSPAALVAITPKDSLAGFFPVFRQPGAPVAILPRHQKPAGVISSSPALLNSWSNKTGKYAMPIPGANLS